MTDDERIAALKAERDRALARAYELSAAYLRTLDERHVGPMTDARGIRERLRSQLSDEGEDAEAVVADMAVALDPGIVASTGPRYYGFVIGGAVPAASAADLLTTAWNQNGALHALSPAAAAAEEIAGEWMLDLLGLPADASCGSAHRSRAGQRRRHGGRPPPAAAAHRLGRGGGWPLRGAGDRGDHRRRGARHRAHRAAVPGLRPRSRDPRRHRRAGPDAGGRAADRGGGAGPAIAAAGDRAGGQRQHRRLRPGGRDRGCPGGAPERVAARRRRLRPVGGRLPGPAPPGGRGREGGLVVDRRPQVAERGLRLRLRGGPRPGGAPLGHGGHRRLPHAQRSARVVGVRVRQLATRSRLRPVRHYPLAWDATASARWSNDAAGWRAAWPISWPTVAWRS